MNKYDYFSKNLIEITNFDKNRGTVFYKSHKKIDSNLKIIIADKHNGFIIHQELLGVFPSNVEYYTDFSIFKKFIHQDILVIFKSNDEFFLIETLRLYDEPNFNPYSNFKFNFDADFCSYYEIFEKEMYKKFSIDVEEGDVVVDIGSNVGAFIKYANDKKAKIIYSCEPNPACIKIIEKHYALNNVILNKYAISDKNGISELEIPFNSDTSGCSKITEANIKNTFTDVKTIQIETITFKNFIEKNNILKIDYLKVDCEGGEAFVFKDENKTFFQQNVKKIVLEFHNESKFDIIKLLKSINYSIDIVDENQKTGMIYAKNKNFYDLDIVLSFFVSKNSLSTFDKTIESFHKHCKNLSLIKELFLVNDRCPDIYAIKCLIKNYFPQVKISEINKTNEVKNNHAEIFETFRKELITRDAKYCFFLEDDWLFIKDFDLLALTNILNKSNYCQIVLSTDFKNLDVNKNLNWPTSEFLGFIKNEKKPFFHITKKIEEEFFWSEVIDYTCFSLNPSLIKIDFFKKGGSIENDPVFELLYNLSNKEQTNLLSEEHFCYHIGDLKKIEPEQQNTKSNLKIGVLFASYNCADHIDRCFQPWLNLREELNLVLASTNGRYDLSDLKFDYKGNDSLIKLLGKNLDFLVHSTSVNHRWSEEQSRTYMLNYMLDRKVDLIFVIDADEFYTEEQIRNILKYIKENPNYDAYNVQFKNYVIKLPYWIEGFNKSVIYWCDRHSGIKCFNFDCEIAYNDGTIIQKNTNVNIIPKNIAFVEHYSWLENDPRTKEKTVLQNIKYFGEENLKCSFCYDENNNLIVNENFYRKRIGLLPTFHKTINKHCCDFDIYLNENDNSFHIKNVLVNKSFIFSIYNGETNDLIYAPLMNLSANLNYYINCGINLKSYKSFKIIVIDVETNKEIHDELLFLKI
jgi:FkbM family methyltransferase